MDLDDRAKRCRVMWEKARNMYGAFFAELSDVMTTMTPREFDDWCYKSVGVSVNVAIKASEVLKATDAARVQAELKTVQKAAKEAAKQDMLDLKAKQVSTRLTMEKNLTAIREQQAINSGLKYEPQSPMVGEILSELAGRRTRTRIENGIAYLRLRQAIKSGAEGLDPATGKKWKWEKWAELAIGRPIHTIRVSMQAAKKELSKNVTPVTVLMKPLNGQEKSTVVDRIYELDTADRQFING